MIVVLLASVQRIRKMKYFYKTVFHCICLMLLVSLLSCKASLMPIQKAVLSGDISHVKQLISRRPDLVKVKTKWGGSLLHLIASSHFTKQKLKTLDFLLENNADVNATDNSGETALHKVMRNPVGHPDVIRILLKHGADREIRNKSGLTVTGLAVAANNAKALHVLIEHGADPNEKLDYFVGEGGYFHEHDRNKSDKGELALIHLAALNGVIGSRHVPAVSTSQLGEILLKNGANANARDWLDRTPLHFAAHVGRMDFIELLVKYKANINAKMSSGYTPLHLAVIAHKRPHHQSAKTLIAHGADSTIKDSYDRTPLQIAVENQDSELVTLLLPKTSNPHTQLLHIAAYGGDIVTAKLLLKAGVDINAKDKMGWSPLHVSANYGRKTMVAFLLNRKANIDAPGKDGRTPLHVNVASQNPDILKILLENKANIQAKDQHGQTPLHLAACHRSQELGITIIKTLIFHQAEILAKDAQGQTPLHTAAGCGRLDVVKLLVRLGADLTAEDKAGRTPLSIAQEKRNVEMSKLLSQLK